MLAFLQKLFDRIEIGKQDSEAAHFLYLMYAGEMILKAATLAMVAGIEDDCDRHRYRQLYKLVRADGLGDWAACIDEVLSGAASQSLVESVRAEQKELTKKCEQGAWQYDCVARLDHCLRTLDPNREQFPFRLDGRAWFAYFVELRNRTKAHGAPSAATCGALSGPLEDSLRTLVEHFALFKREWAYIHRNLSGKYRVTRISESAGGFDPLKTSTTATKWGNLPDGVYVLLNRPRYVELLVSDAEISDLWVPNGAFTSKKFEVLSLTSDTRKQIPATPYLSPAGDLPNSETQGLGLLDAQGKTFTNIPNVPVMYVSRPSLESELESRLLNDRNAVVTLVGRGGIGKTSLALTVLHKIKLLERFGAAFWFSSRDIDLLPEGPKLVRPHLLTENDIAKELVRLVQPQDSHVKGFKATDYLAQCLTKSPLSFPLLFVFDNFETVRSPQELFAWVDTYVRNPNKVLITSRSREFKGDYPVEVFGMTEAESDMLMQITAKQLLISPFLTDELKREIYRESDGHPYVIKMLLGEMANSRKPWKVERIVAGRGEVLDALFERTYAGLSPSAKQIFLTLCNWRSVIPRIAIEAVTLRLANERLDVDGALDELRRNSFVEITELEEDEGTFLFVPLVAAVFGKRKLDVSPMKSAVEANLAVLQFFGAAQRSDIRHGIGPRIERFYRRVADLVSKQPEKMAEYVPMLEFIARRYYRGWWLLADLYEETDCEGAGEKAKDCIRRFLEHDRNVKDKREGWERLAQLCRQTGDGVGEIHALVELCSVSNIDFDAISNAVNRWNQLFKQQHLPIGTDERAILGTKLLNLAEGSLGEAEATDFSRLAWLAMALRDEAKARQFVLQGLAKDPHNEYCVKLSAKLGVQYELPEPSDWEGGCSPS